MENSESDSNCAQSDDVDLARREVLASLAKYTATVAGASTVLLTASASVSVASISGGRPREGGGQWPREERREWRREVRRDGWKEWLRNRKNGDSPGDDSTG